VNFAEQAPSKQWAALKYRGVKIAEVWFKSEGEPLALTFRISQASFQIPGMGQHLTLENLLRAVNIEPEEVKSWRQGDVSHSVMDEINAALGNPLSAPAADVPHLEIHIRLKEPSQTVAHEESAAVKRPTPKWQDLETRWKAIQTLEASLDALRISMETLRNEMEASSKKTLSTEEKLHALRADVAQWTKAKNRLHHVLPRAREFIHRAVWMMGTPERKRLEELYKNHIQPHVPFPDMHKALEQIESLQKDRQVLSAHGTGIYQECKAIATDVQGALRTLQSNAATNALKKRDATRAKGKFS
jgi:hypothetical protein